MPYPKNSVYPIGAKELTFQKVLDIKPHVKCPSCEGMLPVLEVWK